MEKESGTYLDWASAAPVSAEAKEAFTTTLGFYGNPFSPHAEGVRAKHILDESRRAIARMGGVKPESVIFTSGATEANNLAIQGHVRALLAKGRLPHDIHVLYLPTSHASVVETMQKLEREGIWVEKLVLSEGAIDLMALKAQLRPETALLSMDLICGETGIRYDARDVRRVLDTVRKDQLLSVADKAEDVERSFEMSTRILLHVDASQAPFIESYEHTHLGADFITLDAQKVGGVRGIGALIRPSMHATLLPLAEGGGQEQGLRPGTESPALAHAFASALQSAEVDREVFVARAANMKDSFISYVATHVSDAILNIGKENASHIINMSFPARDTDYAVILLSEAGFYVSTKSACETDSEEGSRAVFALTGDGTLALSTLRISFGPTSLPEDVVRFQEELIRTIAFLDSTPSIVGG